MARFGLKPTDLGFEGVHHVGVSRGMLAMAKEAPAPELTAIEVPIQSMAHLKSMIGVPDEHYTNGECSDRCITYPPALPARRQALAANAANICDLEYQLTCNEREHIEKAAHAYLQGNSEKVKSFEPLLDALYTPGTMKVFTGEALVVKAGTTYVLGDTSKPDSITAYNFTSVTVEAGGQLKVISPVNLTTQIFISK